MSHQEKPAGAHLMDRLRNEHVSLRWGVLALIAMLALLLNNAI